MNASATKAVPLSLVISLIMAKGRNTMSSARMRVPVVMKVLQSVTARINACKFWAMKIMYAEWYCQLSVSLVGLMDDIPVTKPI